MELQEELFKSLLTYGAGMMTSFAMYQELAISQEVVFSRGQIGDVPGSEFQVTICITTLNKVEQNHEVFTVLTGLIVQSTSQLFVSGAQAIAATKMNGVALVMPTFILEEGYDGPKSLMRDYASGLDDRWKDARYRLFDPDDAFAFVPNDEDYHALILAYFARGHSAITAVIAVLDCHASRQYIVDDSSR